MLQRFINHRSSSILQGCLVMDSMTKCCMFIEGGQTTAGATQTTDCIHAWCSRVVKHWWPASTICWNKTIHDLTFCQKSFHNKAPKQEKN
jgi:hypothetical protein